MCLSNFLKVVVWGKQNTSASKQGLLLQGNISLGFLLCKSHPKLWLIPGLSRGKGEKRRGGRKVWELKVNPKTYSFVSDIFACQIHDPRRMINTLKNLI